MTVVSDGESITAVCAKEGRVEAGIPVSERKIDLADQRVLDATGDAGQDQAVVYVTGTGTKYHLRDCETLERSRTITALTVEQAKEAGYGACGVCGPPT